MPKNAFRILLLLAVNYRFILLTLAYGLLISCRDDPYSKTATLSFETTQIQFDEGKGNAEIAITLDRERNVSTPVKISWQPGNSTSFLGGDFQLSTEAEIKAFNRTSYVSIFVKDDEQIDSNDELTIRFVASQDPHVKLDDQSEEVSITIVNNDRVNPNALQADLTWSRAKPGDDVSGINLDLFLLGGVQISGSDIIDYGQIYASSDKPLDFETLYLRDSDVDQSYFFAVYFQQGFVAEEINFWLDLNGKSFDDLQFTKTLNETDVGTAFLIGPFTKSGTSLQLAGRMRTQPHLYPADKDKSTQMFGH